MVPVVVCAVVVAVSGVGVWALVWGFVSAYVKWGSKP